MRRDHWWQARRLTGAGDGLGRASAIYLARQGARVVVNDIDASKADAVAGEIAAAGGTARSIASTVAGWATPLALDVRRNKESGIGRQ